MCLFKEELDQYERKNMTEILGLPLTKDFSTNFSINFHQNSMLRSVFVFNHESQEVQKVTIMHGSTAELIFPSKKSLAASEEKIKFLCKIKIIAKLDQEDMKDLINLVTFKRKDGLGEQEESVHSHPYEASMTTDSSFI
jgi:hypothetical protein